MGAWARHPARGSLPCSGPSPTSYPRYHADPASGRPPWPAAPSDLIDGSPGGERPEKVGEGREGRGGGRACHRMTPLLHACPGRGSHAPAHAPKLPGGHRVAWHGAGAAAAAEAPGSA